MASTAESSRGRRAPYAPIGALHGFLKAVRNSRIPIRVDREYLRRHQLAPGNEWAFISALKFLGIVDPQGHPTAAFRRLQGNQDVARQAFANLVRTAYQPLFEDGAGCMSSSGLEEWFARNSSVSQAPNARRFFLEACRLASLTLEPENENDSARDGRTGASRGGKRWRGHPGDGTVQQSQAVLLDKVPAFEGWPGTVSEYLEVLHIFERLIGTPKA